MIVSSVSPQPTWHSREVAPVVRETLAALDAADVAVLRAQDDLAVARSGVKTGLITAAVGLLAGTAAGFALAGMAAVTPTVVTSGVVFIAGAVIAGSAPSEIRSAKAQLEEKRAEVVQLGQKLDAVCAQDRPLNEQSLQNSGGGTLSLMRHVDSDPYVAAADHRFAHAGGVVSRYTDLLAKPRSERFAAAPVRTEEIWRDRADFIGLMGLLGAVGTAWVGFSAGVVLESAYPMLAGLAVAAGEWFGVRQFGHKLAARSVDKQMKHEMQAEVALYQPRLEALRTARDATRQATVERYATLVNEVAAPVPGDVRVEDGRVIIGGVSVPRS